MASSGADIVSIASALGDTIETVSKTYLHKIDKAEKEAVEKCECFVEKLKAELTQLDTYKKTAPKQPKSIFRRRILLNNK